MFYASQHDDPCQLVWQVKEFGRLERTTKSPCHVDPCRLARQVKQFGKREKLIHPPDKLAGVCGILAFLLSRSN